MNAPIDAAALSLAVAAALATRKPTRRATKRCAKRMARAVEKLGDVRSVSIGPGARGTAENMLAAKGALENLCNRCGWCAVYGIRPRPPSPETLALD